MKEFDTFIELILEADTGVPDPSAASSAKTASALGGKLPSPSAPSNSIKSPSRFSAARSKLTQAVDKSKLGAMSRTAAMAVGKSPMDRWEVPVNSANVYSLDPTGSSSHVIAKFQSTSTNTMDVGDETFESFETFYKTIMENDSPEISAENPQWVSAMENIIIAARQSSSGAYPITLAEFAANKFIDYSKVAKRMAISQMKMKTEEENIEAFNSLSREEQNLKIAAEEDKLNIQNSKSIADFNNLHEQLKIAFKERGLYCGTREQFEKFKSGQISALGDVAKGIGNMFQQTGGLKDVGTN